MAKSSIYVRVDADEISRELVDRNQELARQLADARRAYLALEQYTYATMRENGEAYDMPPSVLYGAMDEWRSLAPWQRRRLRNEA